VLRTFAATVVAIATGLANWMFRTHHPAPGPEAGDRAPDFALPGSDGRTHRLADFVGRTTVVLAWFPKAFTGG
jgi:thioredoxin-dependent peroxiredoxin